MSRRGERMPLGLVGCGGMGTRHLHALQELDRAGLSDWDLVGVCDLDPTNAAAVAGLAEQFFGRRPAVFGNMEDLVRNCRPAAVDIVTVTVSHHELVVRALEMGVHVMVEKPLAITMRAAGHIQRAAQRAGLVVSVAENYRRDPMNRLVKALLRSGALGMPRMLVESHLSPGGNVVITPWRHSKASGGVLLDIAVHHADMLQYFLGKPAEVTAWAGILEPVRVWERRDTPTAEFYGVVNRDAGGEYVATAEDSALALFAMEGGSAAQWSLVQGAGGAPALNYRRIYCELGTIMCPGDRSGDEVAVYMRGLKTPKTGAAVLELVPDFRLPAPMPALFGAERLGGYELEFNAADRRITASEYWELARCVLDGQAPEVGIAEGKLAMAATYGVLESMAVGAAVRIDDVLACKAYVYQAEIDATLGIA